MKNMGWRAWRRISQVFFLFLFLYLAARTQVPQSLNLTVFSLTSTGQDLRLSGPISLFFDLDPLVSLGAMFSSWTLKPSLLLALAVLVPVLMLGRFFCGFVCPFGALNQVCSQAGRQGRLAEKTAANQPSLNQRYKYFILIFLLGAALLGSNQTGWLDPLAFLFRGLVLAVFPALSYFLSQGSAWLAGTQPPFSFLAYAGPFALDHLLGYGPRVYQTALIMGGPLILVLALNRRRPRFFCRTICPLGAALGLFSRYSLIHLTKDESLCTDCGLCRADCQGASGPHPKDAWLRAECHLCFNCQAACPTGAIKFRFQPGHPRPLPTVLNPKDAPDLTRRAVVGSLLGGAALVGLSRAALAAPGRPGPDLIRPPGTLEESEFLKRCVRCGLCLRVCPTNVLTPALGEAGLEGVWTPVLNFRLGYCEYNCTLCSSVCPTGAIKLITGREKTQTPIRLGSAFFDRGRCLPWSGQGPCLVCEEHCPVSPKAIYLVPLETATDKDKTEKLLAPQVNLTRCVGCGICSYKCPVLGRPAVYVTSVGESRSPANRILLPEKKKKGP
ncbi:MAG: 4Fe-4S dicluster domain-containing protein [Thermodesulfobacteriota bacterium]